AVGGGGGGARGRGGSWVSFLVRSWAPPEERRPSAHKPTCSRPVQTGGQRADLRLGIASVTDAGSSWDKRRRLALAAAIAVTAGHSDYVPRPHAEGPARAGNCKPS